MHLERLQGWLARMLAWVLAWVLARVLSRVLSWVLSRLPWVLSRVLSRVLSLVLALVPAEAQAEPAEPMPHAYPLLLYGHAGSQFLKLSFQLLALCCHQFYLLIIAPIPIVLTRGTGLPHPMFGS